MHPPSVHWSKFHLDSQTELGSPLIDPKERGTAHGKPVRPTADKHAWHTKQPLKAWKPAGPDAGVSPWVAASTCRQPKGIIPAEHGPRD